MAFSWLDKIGKDVIHFFEKAVPVAQEVDAVAAPFITAFAPALQTAISLTLTEIAKAQALGIAAGNTQGSDSVKFAAVISAIAPQLGAIIQGATGVAPTNANYTTFINSLVAAAGAFEAISTTPAPLVPGSGVMQSPVVSASPAGK